MRGGRGGNDSGKPRFVPLFVPVPWELKTAIRNHLLSKELRIVDLKEMPKVGLEPTRPLGTMDFESIASAIPPLRLIPAPLGSGVTLGAGRHSLSYCEGHCRRGTNFRFRDGKIT